MMVDIVIPVYNAPDDVLRCVQSVLQHTSAADYRLLLIDDGSPDVNVKKILAKVAEFAPQVRILANENNLGFTATVNRAFRETAADVLLLNSDTVVTTGWLTAMTRCLASDERIASVTPFSNNAEIASVPEWLRANPAPDDAIAATWARAARELDEGRDYVDVPTGVGFCMLMRRAAIDAVGAFDEATFGRGYGEENDWCQRAIKDGWRNVLCHGAYVVHTGGQSFSDAKAALVAANIVKLNKKHPNYDLDVQRFIAADPLRRLRETLISRQRVHARSDTYGVLHILHGKDGGLERHARDLIALQPQARHYLLLALGEEWTIEDHALHSQAPLTFTIRHVQDELWSKLFEGVCQRFDIDRVHVHHISACRDGLMIALEATTLPIEITVHDFYFACPAVHLMRGDDRYCGAETDAAKCQACVNTHRHAPRVNVMQWREANEQLLRHAQRIIAPSRFTATTLQRYFPDVAIDVVPHGAVKPVANTNEGSVALTPIPDDGWQRITIVGAIGPLKGARWVERIAQYFHMHQIPARIVLIGYLDVQFHPGVREHGHLVIHGRYSQGELPQLLAAYDTSFVLFPCVGPETFGYTLSEVWDAGYPAVVTDVGTLAERVHATGFGRVVPAIEDANFERWVSDVLKGVPDIERGSIRAEVAAAEATDRSPLTKRETRRRGAHVAITDSLEVRTGIPLQRWNAGSQAVAVRANQSLAIRIAKKAVQHGIRYRHTALMSYLIKAIPPQTIRKVRDTLLR